jgi:hypothetical protein
LLYLACVHFKNKTKTRQKLDKTDSDKIPLNHTIFWGCKEVLEGDMILMKRDKKGMFTNG